MLYRLIVPLVVLWCSASNAAEQKDARLAPIAAKDLKTLIQKTPISSSLHARLTARGSTSGLQRLLYQQYTLKWKEQPEDGYTNLRRGIAAQELWQDLRDKANRNGVGLQPEFYQLWDVTRSCLAKSVDKLPRVPAAHIAYGSFLWQWNGQMDKGLRLLRKAAELDPNDARAHANLGNVYSNHSGNAYNPQKAEEELRLAIRLEPVYAYPHWLLVQLYVAQRRYQDAQREVQAYLSLVPASQQAAERNRLSIYQSAINRGLQR